ncbi:unnamed protein product [Polarella glacialis]|uniref:50S ribosomal protein L17 n=1 Tax=Polarella glacialis TaxID=89957 RepID=A0A813KGY5_POLGL|nr:unnamed protein product [Polarella glacialis]
MGTTVGRRPPCPAVIVVLATLGAVSSRCGPAFSIPASSGPAHPILITRAADGLPAPQLLKSSSCGTSGSSGFTAFGSFAASLAMAAAARVLVGGTSADATGRTTMFFKKRYGGGPVKKDPDAEFGPQYDGPPIHYQIQRGPRLGFPKGGEQRVIPKLSGGSYDNRKRMMQNLTTELVRHGRIKTTRARAEALCFFVDRMILLAKRGDDLARREADEWMFDEKLVENLFKLAPERYPDQTKDFCKVTRTMNRKGDYSEMAYIELL